MSKKYHQHLVAFIDILGFKKIVDGYFNGTDTKSLILLKSAMKEAEGYAIQYSKNYLKQFNIKFTFKQFSDCISISMPFKQKENHDTITIYGAFINVVRMYQLTLLLNKIYVRGGISVGGHFENSNIIFSDALVKAYKLESQSAIYPRILIDKEILHLINEGRNKTPSEFQVFYELFGNSIIKDWDGEVFISPFGILGELQAMGKIYGEEELKKIISIYKEVNKIEDELPDDFYEELCSIKGDKMMLKPALEDVNEFLLKNQQEKFEVLNKYIWMKEFIVWSLTPRKSNIKFERYFKNQDV